MTTRFRAALLLLLFASAAPAADSRRAFTLDDLYRVKSVAEPAISPDGKTVVYSVTTNDWASKKKTVALWRVDADGKNARPLTFPGARRASLLLARREDARVRLDARRRPAGLLPAARRRRGRAEDRLPGGVANPAFSNDGRLLVFAADVFPACGADAACNRKGTEARERNKLKAHLADTLLYRHWTEWKEGKRTHVLVLDLARRSAEGLRDLTPGDFDSPVFMLGGGHGLRPLPGGNGAGLLLEPRRRPRLSTNADVSRSRSRRRRRGARTAEEPHRGESGLRRLAALFAGRPLSRVPAPAHAPLRGRPFPDRPPRPEIGRRDLTASFDDTVRDFELSKDDSRLFFTADVKGRTPLYEVGGRHRDDPRGLLRRRPRRCGDRAGRRPSPSSRGGGSEARRSCGGSTIARERTRPGIRLTTHNAALEEEVDIRPAEEMIVPGAGGKPVQMWIVKPHGFDPRRSTR